MLPQTMRHRWLRHIHPFRDLETNPQTQYRVHTYAQRFWLMNVPVFVYTFYRYPQQFVAWGILITGLYSLYANWATDNGAAAAAKTVMQTQPGNAEVMAEIKTLEQPAIGDPNQVSEF